VLEALRTLVARVRDLVMGGVDESSSLAASMSVAAELLESRINTVAANGVHWGPVLHWLPLCHISRSWRPSWRCLGPDAAQA
jgi:hypothetical protein